MAQAMQDLRAREAEILEQVTGVVGQPAAMAEKSRIVISRVTHGSYISNPGSRSLILESQVISPSPTKAATTVEAIGLESEAS